MVTEPGSAEEAIAARQTQVGASWFTWIAGLTLVNVVAALFGSDWVFLLSLMLPIGAAAEAHKMHGGWYVATVLLTVIGVGLFLLLGRFAKKGARGAFITGLLLYGVDTLICLGSREWLGLALHAYALWSISKGLGGANRLAALRRQNAPAAQPWAPPQGQYVGASDPQQWPPAPIQTQPRSSASLASPTPYTPPFGQDAPVTSFTTGESPRQERAAASPPEIGTPDTRIDGPDTRIDAPDTNLGRLDTRIDKPDDRLDTPDV